MKHLSRLFYRSLFILGVFATGSALATDERLLTVSGHVFDQNGQAVAQAEVVIEDLERRLRTLDITDSSGEFTFTVPSGNYIVTAKASGFSEVQQRLAVTAEAAGPVAIVLPVAGAEATVTVSDGSGYQAELTGTATKTFTPLRDVPQSISVVGRQQIVDQQFSSIGDIVRYLPGVTAHQGENNRDQVIIRGQSSSADFFLNGVRDDVQYYRDLYNLERLEVLRGPNAMIFGRGGGGGVVNRVTKTAGFSPVQELVLQVGSFGNKRAAGDLGTTLGKKAAVRANGVFEDSGSFREYVNLRRFGINPTLTLAPDGDTSITLGYEYFRDRRVADRGIGSFQGKPLNVDPSTYFGNPDDSHVRANVNVFTATIDRRFGNLLVHNRTMYGDYDRFYQNYVPGATTDDGTRVTLSAYNNATDRKNFFSQTDISYTVATGRIKHSLLGGFEYGRQRTGNFRNTGYFNNLATSMQVDVSDPVTRVPITFRQGANVADNDVNTDIAAAYLQDQVEINRWVQIVAGVRFDNFDLDYRNNRDGSQLRRIDNLVSPRIGVVVKPIETLSLYTSYSVSYLPSSGDQFSSLTDITQQLKPERFKNVEFGAKWDALPALSFTSAVYRLDRTNTRSTDPNDPTRIVQTGSQRTNGLEVGVNGNITNKWSVAGGYAYQNAFYSTDTASAPMGNQVAQVPHHSFSIWNKYQLLKKLGLGFGVINRSDMFAAVDNTLVLPGYTRADAAVFYNFNEKWRLQGNIENLFDTRYFLNANNNTNINPGSPRSAKISLVARF